MLRAGAQAFYGECASLVAVPIRPSVSIIDHSAIQFGVYLGFFLFESLFLDFSFVLFCFVLIRKVFPFFFQPKRFISPEQRRIGRASVQRRRGRQRRRRRRRRDEWICRRERRGKQRGKRRRKRQSFQRRHFLVFFQPWQQHFLPFRHADTGPAAHQRRGQ